MHEPFPFFLQLFGRCLRCRISSHDHNPVTGKQAIAQAVKNAANSPSNAIPDDCVSELSGRNETKAERLLQRIVAQITQNKKTPADGSTIRPDILEFRAIRDPPGAGDFHCCEALYCPARPGCIAAPTLGLGITCRVGRCDGCIEVLLL